MNSRGLHTIPESDISSEKNDVHSSSSVNDASNTSEYGSSDSEALDVYDSQETVSNSPSTSIDDIGVSNGMYQNQVSENAISSLPLPPPVQTWNSGQRIGSSTKDNNLSYETIERNRKFNTISSRVTFEDGSKGLASTHRENALRSKQLMDNDENSQFDAIRSSHYASTNRSPTSQTPGYGGSMPRLITSEYSGSVGRGKRESFVGNDRLDPTVEESINALIENEKKQDYHVLSSRERQEYYRLKEVYSENNAMIYQKKEKIIDLYNNYTDMKNNQMDEIEEYTLKQKKQNETIDRSEFELMRENYRKEISNREKEIKSNINKYYVQPVDEMMEEADTHIRNMNRWIGIRLLYMVLYLVRSAYMWIVNQINDIFYEDANEKPRKEDSAVLRKLSGKSKKASGTRKGARKETRKETRKEKQTKKRHSKEE